MNRPTYEIKRVDGMRTLAVKSFGWDDALLDVIQSKSIEFLSVQGVESDIDFVRELSGLRRLSLTVQKPRDLRALESLKSVRDLFVGLGPGRTPPVALDSLPHLSHLSVDWVPGLEAVAACTTVDKLTISRPPTADLAWLAGMTQLKQLMLTDSRRLTRLSGLEALQNLRCLVLTNLASLESLDGVQHLQHLEFLDVTSCRKFATLDPVAALSALTKLAVNNCGDIASLRPLSSLTGLREFFAIESTRILDGDLSPLMELPNLQRFGMRSRREYRPSVEEVGAKVGPWIPPT